MEQKWKVMYLEKEGIYKEALVRTENVWLNKYSFIT